MERHKLVGSRNGNGNLRNGARATSITRCSRTWAVGWYGTFAKVINRRREFGTMAKLLTTRNARWIGFRPKPAFGYGIHWGRNWKWSRLGVDGSKRIRFLSHSSRHTVRFTFWRMPNSKPGPIQTALRLTLSDNTNSRRSRKTAAGPTGFKAPLILIMFQPWSFRDGI